MELVNTTGVAARCVVHERGPGDRVALLTAKATFGIGPRPRLDADQALPLFEADRPTEGGLIPGDAIGRFDDGFEVCSVGSAHAPQPVRAMTVSLSVGSVRRDLLVVGDRRVGRDGSLSRPEPFCEMPLGWGRSFGGTTSVALDRDALLPVSHPLNALGRGFDAGPSAQRIARRLGVPSGYPVVTQPRQLPNVEHPQRPIRSASDDPEPYGWSAIPTAIGLCLRARERYASLRPRCDPAGYRAHPDWVGEIPAPGAEVVARGLSADGPVRFALPRLRIFADARGARVELCPQTLVLCWHRGLFTLTYRRAVSLAKARPHRVRLRLAEGWWTEHRNGAAA